jgi:hypothetical protein
MAAVMSSKIINGVSRRWLAKGARASRHRIVGAARSGVAALLKSGERKRINLFYSHISVFYQYHESTSVSVFSNASLYLHSVITLYSDTVVCLQ